MKGATIVVWEVCSRTCGWAQDSLAEEVCLKGDFVLMENDGKVAVIRAGLLDYPWIRLSLLMGAGE